MQISLEDMGSETMGSEMAREQTERSLAYENIIGSVQ